MDKPNYIQFVECIIYFVCLTLALTFLVPMIFNVSEFEGKCLLFTTGVFNESDGRIFEPKWSNFSYCGLILANGVFLVILSSIQLIRAVNLFRKGKNGSIVSTFWSALVAFVAFLFTLENSISVTFGYIKWCNSITQNFESCEDAADSNVMIISNTTIKPDKFYLELGIVQIGIWASLVFWFFIFVISGFKFYEYHQRENLIISMNRQRRRYQTIEEE